MNDPHVETLTYKLKPIDEVVQFNDPPPLAEEEVGFSYLLENGILTVTMKEHHDTAEAARSAVVGFLEAWRIVAALDLDRIPMDFVFEGAKLVDRNPPSPELGIVGEGSVSLRSITCDGTGSVTQTPLVRREYPRPPKGFKASPDVKTLWDRYQRHTEDKEPRQAMAYFCLTVVESSAGTSKPAKPFKSRDRDDAAKMYNIEPKVLYKLGELTAETRGTLQDVRKRKAGVTPTPLNADEQRWLTAAVKMLIRRKGEYDHNPAAAFTLRQITMGDLQAKER